MEQEFGRKVGPLGGFLRIAATVLLLAVMAAAGERALAPLVLEGPGDRTAADVDATQAAYRNVAGRAEPDAAQETQPDL